MGKKPPKQQLWESERLVSDTIGRLIEFWGFKRHMGRIWAILYLSDEALSAKDLQERLDISAGTVSATVNELIAWSVIKKTWKKGERREYFIAEGNFWKMISRVFERRERVEILDAIDAMETALEYARAKAEANEGPVRERALMQARRIEQLLELARLGRALLDALVKRARVDATPLMAILLGKKAE